MKKWKRLEPTIVSKIGYRVVVSKLFELPDGSVSHFETTPAEDWQAAAVIALTKDNRVIIARQFRPGPEEVLDELPGGVVDDGESKEESIKRELLEETGYEVGELMYLGVANYGGYFNGKRHCFLATDCKPSKAGAQPGEYEFIEVALITIDQLIESARLGRMTDPGAVLMAYEELQKRRGKE